LQWFDPSQNWAEKLKKITRILDFGDCKLYFLSELAGVSLLARYKLSISTDFRGHFVALKERGTDMKGKAGEEKKKNLEWFDPHSV